MENGAIAVLKAHVALNVSSVEHSRRHLEFGRDLDHPQWCP
jgi:hypothetical protein